MENCKVSESVDSENARVADNADVEEAYNRWVAHHVKIKLLKAAIRKEKIKRDISWLRLGAAVYRLIKMVKKYVRDEHKEAEAIIKRRRAERIARNYLKYRSKQTRD